MIVSMSPTEDILFNWVHELAMQHILSSSVYPVCLCEQWAGKSFSYLCYLVLSPYCGVYLPSHNSFTFIWKTKIHGRKILHHKIYTANFMFWSAPLPWTTLYLIGSMPFQQYYGQPCTTRGEKKVPNMICTPGSKYTIPYLEPKKISCVQKMQPIVH